MVSTKLSPAYNIEQGPRRKSRGENYFTTCKKWKKQNVLNIDSSSDNINGNNINH